MNSLACSIMEEGQPCTNLKQMVLAERLFFLVCISDEYRRSSDVFLYLYEGYRSPVAHLLRHGGTGVATCREENSCGT